MREQQCWEVLRISSTGCKGSAVDSTLVYSVVEFNVTYSSVLRSMMWSWSPGKQTKGLCFMLCDLCSVTREVVAKLQDEITVNPIFTGWRGREISWMTLFFLINKGSLTSFPAVCVFFCAGTKDQLDALTSDIKGNANVVRTKLKCESNHYVIVT